MGYNSHLSDWSKSLWEILTGEGKEFHCFLNTVLVIFQFRKRIYFDSGYLYDGKWYLYSQGSHSGSEQILPYYIIHSAQQYHVIIAITWIQLCTDKRVQGRMQKVRALIISPYSEVLLHWSHSCRFNHLFTRNKPGVHLSHELLQSPSESLPEH